MNRTYRGSAPAGPFLFPPDPRVGGLDRRVRGATHPVDPGSLAGDPTGAGRAARDRAAGPLVYGVVDLHLPHVNWYRVKTVEYGPLGCCLGGPAGAGALGVRELAACPPGTPVLVWPLPGAAHGVIVAALPPDTKDGRRVTPDWLQQGGGTGLLATGLWRHLLAHSPAGLVPDWSGGRPLDEAGYERGWVGALGTAVWLSDFQVELRATEEAGLSLVALDGGYARLAGRQFDLHTGGHELSVRDDEGEVRFFEGVAGFPWEGHGLLDPGRLLADAFPDAAVQFGGGVASVDAPGGRADLRPVYRTVRYGGYLGQGSFRAVVLPPSGREYSRFLDPDDRAGVFLEATGFDGSHTLLSARRLTVGRRVSLPAPVDLLPPEHPLGDDARGLNYKASGKWGEGDEHRLRDPDPGGDDAHLKRAVTLLDRMAHAVAWRAAHPFRLHKKDFHVADDGAGPLGAAQADLAFAPLAEGGPMAPPDGVSRRVDDREGEVSYTPTENYTEYLPDGGVATVDGFGGDDVATAGSRRISQPGDLILSAGGTIVLMADQVVLRGRTAVDLTAARGAVTVKAETDVRVLGGNGGAGGVLVESRAKTAAQPPPGAAADPAAGPGPAPAALNGVVLRAADSAVVASGAEVYLRTGEQGGREGDIVLDAAGRQSVVINAYQPAVFAGRQLAVAVGPADAPAAVHVLGDTAAVLDAPLYVGGGVVGYRDGPSALLGQLAVQGAVLSGGKMADIEGGLLGAVGPGFGGALAASAGRVAERADRARETAAAAYQGQVDAPFRQADRPGHPDVLDRVFRFRLRPDAGYRTDKLALTEPRWCQFGRLGKADTAGTRWEEPAVTTPEGDTYPWPGRAAWLERPTVLRPAAYGLAGASDRTLAEAELPDVEKVPLAESLAVTAPR